MTGHAHGTPARYNHGGCRCDRCRVGVNRANQKRLMRKASGAALSVPAGPVRDHVKTLQTAGAGLRRIADLAGISLGTLDRVIYGRSEGVPLRSVRSATAARLFRVTAAQAAGVAAMVDGTGTRRRLEALCAVGWTRQQLAVECGLTAPSLRRLMREQTPVLASTRDRVRGVYDRLWMQQPPQVTGMDRRNVRWALRDAQRRGFVPPGGWDDDVIDDPAAVPDVGEQTWSFGRIDVSEVEWLRSFGTSDELIAQQLGVTVSGLRKSLWKQAAA